jgi:hypothetical protein
MLKSLLLAMLVGCGSMMESRVPTEALSDVPTATRLEIDKINDVIAELLSQRPELAENVEEAQRQLTSDRLDVQARNRDFTSRNFSRRSAEMTGNAQTMKVALERQTQAERRLGEARRAEHLSNLELQIARAELDRLDARIHWKEAEREQRRATAVAYKHGDINPSEYELQTTRKWVEVEKLDTEIQRLKAERDALKR